MRKVVYRRRDPRRSAGRQFATVPIFILIAGIVTLLLIVFVKYQETGIELPGKHRKREEPRPVPAHHP